MPDPAQSDLNALLGSRICHDLISPLGAISNGVELLELSGLSDMPELGLIAQSIAAANARIRFFRVAFGLASPGQQIARSEIEDILAGICTGTRLRITLHSDAGVPRTQARLLFLLIQCYETALPRGGTIAITQSGPEWDIACHEPPTLAFDPGLWGQIDGSQGATEDNAMPAKVHFLLVGPAATAAGQSISVTHTATSLGVHLR